MSESYKIYASKDYVDSKALPEGAGVHQQLITGTDGNTKWSDYAYTRVKQVFVYNGDYAKTPSTAPGYSTNALYTSMFTLAKISDYVPTIDELFSDETTAIFDSGVVGEDIPDLKHVYDGYYGRFKFTKAPSTVTNPSSKDGLFPGIIVVSKPSIVFEVFDCYEPGIYIWTSKTGKQYATKSVTINCALPMDSSVPYISSSQLGQTITVKSIDENGKPTAWETENVVKTINSVEPDENGNVSFVQPCAQSFMTMPNGVIVNMFTMPVQDVITQLAGRFAYALRIYRIEMMGDDVRYATRVSVGENPTSAVLYFGDDVAPIILDGENNKIITDPNWVAPAESIPAPAVASVGQIITVKSVDGNGKPTEWETIDPWTITSPNGTQFKLTIDDEGILSATELT